MKIQENEPKTKNEEWDGREKPKGERERCLKLAKGTRINTNEKTKLVPRRDFDFIINTAILQQTFQAFFFNGTSNQTGNS